MVQGACSCFLPAFESAESAVAAPLVAGHVGFWNPPWLIAAHMCVLRLSTLFCTPHSGRTDWGACVPCASELGRR